MTSLSQHIALQQRIEELEAALRDRDELLAAAQASEARYRQLMLSNMVGVAFWHVDGRITEANDAFLAIVGYTRDDLAQGGVNWQQMTPPEHAEREREALAQIGAHGVCAPFEKEYIRKDGQRVAVFIGGALLDESSHEGVCFVVDISDRRRVEQQLADSQQLFQAFMENTPTVAFIKDADGKRLYLNRRYKEVFDNGQPLLGKTDGDLFGPEVERVTRQEDAFVRETKVPRESIVNIPTPDGVQRTWLAYKFLVDYDGHPDLLGGVAVDITELTRAKEELEVINHQLETRVSERTHELAQANEELRRENAAKQLAQSDLRKSDDRFRKWLEQSVVSTQIIGRDGLTRQVNHAWEKLWGGTLADITGFNLLTDPQTESLGITNYLRRAFAGEAVFVPETPFVPHVGLFKGQARWCSGVVYPVKDEATGEVEEIVILHQDVTDRVSAEQKLIAEQKTLRKLLDLQDQERKLIAYDIHDGLVQDLIGAQLLIEAFLKDHADDSMQQASSLLRAAIDESRRLINDLRPLVIDEHGVVNTIEFLRAEEERRGGLSVQFFHHVSFDRLPALLEGTLYRIVQECLTNARRHSGSPEVEVWLHEDNGRLRLIVRDYGCGFDPAQVPEDRFGLEGISKRAQIFGGVSKIESHLGEGTTVRVEIPLKGS